MTFKKTGVELEDAIGVDNAITYNTTGAFTLINLDFSTNFTFRFENPVKNTWTIDRLIGQRNLRERIYVASLISGPSQLYLEQCSILEETIIFNQVIGNSSLFERELRYFDANITLLQEIIGRSLVFTENAIKQQGLRIFLPYMIVGETCPFQIKYETSRDLRIVITDSINMPISRLNIELFYYNLPYGTYISNNISQPLAPLSTNDQGEVIIENVPNGNYTIRILQNQKLVKETFVNSYTDVNFISTDLLHFPLFIIIYSMLFGLITLIGILVYLKYRR